MDFRKIITISLSASLLVIASSFAYYLAVYIPNKDKDKQDLRFVRSLKGVRKSLILMAMIGLNYEWL